jgi:SAM-dependent methyltransferase
MAGLDRDFGYRGAGIGMDAAIDASGKFLDIGCGEGDAVAFFSAGYGFSCVGVDASPQMITQCRKLHPGSQFFVADATGLPFGDACFDLVLFECVLSTLEDPSAALREAVRVLAPGGRLIVADLCDRADRETPEQVRAGDPSVSVADAGRMPGGYFDRQGFLDCCASSGLLLLDLCDKTAALDSFAAEILLSYGSFSAWLEATVPEGEDAGRYCAVCLDGEGEGQGPDSAQKSVLGNAPSRVPGYFFAAFSKAQRGKCAVVLAAGLSSRMGGAFKPLLPIEGDAA